MKLRTYCELFRCFPTPKTLEECFLWAFHLVAAAVIMFGQGYVLDRMAKVDGKITTMFSGMDCAAHAWRMIKAAFLELYSFQVPSTMGLMAEIDPHCQRCLLKNFPDRCLFGDVHTWVSAPPADHAWTVHNIQLHKTAYCIAHHKQCKLYERGFLDVSGPPCVLWSRHSV